MLWAINFGFAGVVAQLCAAPGAAAVFDLKGADGLKPLAFAECLGHRGIAATLRAHGAKA